MNAGPGAQTSTSEDNQRPATPADNPPPIEEAKVIEEVDKSDESS